MKSNQYSRRRFIQSYLTMFTGLLGGGLIACQGAEKSSKEEATDPQPASCDDLSGLTAEEIKLRETFGYVQQSPMADNQCSNCNLWIPNENDPSCGRCLLFKGPVYAAGHCTSWAPQT